MRGIINNIINFYQIQAEALNVLVTNAQKALEQSERERKANDQAQRVENFIRNLIMDLNSMFTRFYFFKDRKNRRQGPMTDRQANVMAEFVIFVKTLTKNVCSLLNRFQQGQTFEEKVDKEMRELEASVSQKLREFDKALDETSDTLTIRSVKFVRNITSGFAKLVRMQRIFLHKANSSEGDKSLPKSTANTKEDSPAQIRDGGDNHLKNLFNHSSIKSVTSHNKKSKCLTHLEV